MVRQLWSTSVVLRLFDLSKETQYTFMFKFEIIVEAV